MASLRNACEEPRDVQDIRLVVDTIPTLAWSARPDGSAEFFSQRWLDYTGLSAEQALGSGWQVAIHSDDLPRILETLREALNSVKPYEVEGRFRRFDGEFRWFLFRGSPLRDRSGKVAKWYGTNTDLEERKRAEEALRKSEERWRSVFENSAIGVAVTDLNARYLATNNVYQTIVGYTEEELRALDFLSLTHEDYREANWALITELVEGKRRWFQIEKKYRRKDGSVVWVSNNVSLVPGTERVARFIMALSEDITQRKRAEEALQRSEGYLAEAQKLTRTGSWAAHVHQMENLYWTNVYWSEELFRIFGFDPSPTPPSEVEIVGRLHPEDVLHNKPLVDQAIRGRSDFEVDYRLLLPNGAAKYIHVVGHPVVNASDDVIEIVGTAMDVTERKRAEDALRESEAFLLEAQRLTRTCSWRHEVLSGKVTVSAEGFAMFGIEPEDDASSVDFYHSRKHPKDRPEAEQAYAAALLRKTEFEADFRIVLPDGTIKNIRSIGHPILDERGDVVEFVGAAIDVTEHHRAAQALRRSEAYLAEAQELTKTGSWAMDPRADRVIYLSQETYRIFGFNPADGIPSIERFWQRVHPDDHTRVRARIEDGVRDKVEHSFEYRITLPDGSVKYLRNLRRPVINYTGEVVEVIGTTMDITERKQAEEAKKAAEELASSHVEVMMRSLDVLAKEPAPEKYIAEILRTIAQHLRAHRVMLWLREQNDDSLRLHTVILNDKPIVTDETDHPFVRTSSSWKQIPFLTGMLATKSTAVCEDVEDDSRLTSEWRKYLTSRKTKRLVGVPMFLAGEFRGFISIHHSEAGTYRPDEIELAQSLAQHVMMAVHGQQVAEQERQAAILKERARLARDVHDTLAQGFTGVILQMEAAEEALFDENPDAAVQRVRRAREIARESLGEARRSVHALRPQALDKSGFAEALQSMLKNTTVGTSLRTSFCWEGEPMVLPANVEETLLRIGQEALSNALKHARPTEFHIRLCFKSDAVRLELFDNGKGFVVGQTNGGVGLLGMKERAEQIGATLTISSEPGKGTKIIAVSPNKVETVSS